MEARLENVRIERGYDRGGIDQHEDVILFDLSGANWLEYLDDDDLCDEGDSNLCRHLSNDEGNADEIGERLAAWLALPARSSGCRPRSRANTRAG